MYWLLISWLYDSGGVGLVVVFLLLGVVRVVIALWMRLLSSLLVFEGMLLMSIEAMVLRREMRLVRSVVGS
ncbi:hypothetical protein BHS05_17055 [Myxococcus xanthus]|uniref:Uncharacterized protein n=1 Tax=Myxococcus xanthus TaxID=34 RepID=A0AAE6KSR7_MYXXA|nr:hypothetical protein BHS09_17155 [Myxococcus xanthus]QDE75850.1 hypothetical protein BHS08_17170 [Myxococcus xanthus]QDE97417.1 hypothetical protein BHS05_17055 [Myxococcus xanthus]QDF04996.1 hypothetical protein BHS04_17560 [Myxococcus xanthus]